MEQSEANEVMSVMITHRCEDLMVIFKRCFLEEYNTCLVRGSDEPIYLPASGSRSHHEIRFAHDYFSSALHECAHWFIAGDARRQLEDFGYWYLPDGRTARQQATFESMEAKPQAIEWILSVSAGHRFQVSVDNLNGEESDPRPFKMAVFNQVRRYLADGLPARAETFRHALAAFYQVPDSLASHRFELARL